MKPQQCENLGCQQACGDEEVCMVSEQDTLTCCGWACAADLALRRHFKNGYGGASSPGASAYPPGYLIPRQTNAMTHDQVAGGNVPVEPGHPPLPPNLQRDGSAL